MNTKKLGAFFIGLLIGIPVLLAQNVGDEAPEFSFNDTDGKAFTLSDHRGKVVFMFLFGNTCPSCLGFGNQTETKVNQVYGSNENFVAVGLDIWNSSSTVTSVNNFAESTGITYPLLVKAGAVAQSYGTTYDRLIVVDQEGIIRFKGTTLASQQLDDAIEVIDEYLMLASNGIFNVNGSDRILEVYPNPADDHVNIRFSLAGDSRVSLSLWNSLGQETGIRQEETFGPGEQELRVNTAALNNGLYFYRLDTRKDEILTGRVIVKR